MNHDKSLYSDEGSYILYPFPNKGKRRGSAGCDYTGDDENIHPNIERKDSLPAS
jgi:hypothetical protein